MTQPPSLINFGVSPLDALNAEADQYVSGVGLTVAHIRDGILVGLPFYRDGVDVPSWIIRDAIDAAESKVESDTDMLIWEREVHCVADLDDSELDLDDDRRIYGALDKPKNWFSGQRYGEIKLPIGPAKKLLRVTLLPYGFFSDRRIELAVTPEQSGYGRYASARLDKDRVRFVPGKTGLFFGWTAPWSGFAIYNNETIPNGVEIVYRAGLSARELRQEGAKLRTLVMLQAAIQTLTMMQATIGGGAQKESVATDGLQNTVEVAKRDQGGPLGGEIRALRKNYDELLKSVLNEGALRYTFLG